MRHEPLRDGWYTKLRRAKNRDELGGVYDRLTKAIYLFGRLQILSGPRFHSAALGFRETSVRDERKPDPAPGWTCQAFLAGVVAGALFGLLIGETQGDRGPYQTQIFSGFWGLVGGSLGASGAIACRLMHRRRCEGTSQRPRHNTDLGISREENGRH
jgi:hypothetical protein